VYDLDRNTYITAELTPGANDNTIRFYANDVLVADVNSSRFDVRTLTVDSIQISGNTLTTTGTDQDLILNANGNGSIRIEDFRFQGNTITSTISAPIIFRTTGTGYIDVSDAGGFVIPVGTSANRPPVPLLGMVRYNTADERVELYDGTAWGSIAGSSGAVSVIDATEIAIKYAVTLG
jgi:WD40 repeat protein